MPKEIWIARCLDGPFAGKDATLGTEPKGKDIRVWESLLVSAGTLMHDEEVDDLLPGDCHYVEQSRSTLPEGFHSNVVRGGQYTFVKRNEEPEKDEG